MSDASDSKEEREHIIGEDFWKRKIIALFCVA